MMATPPTLPSNDSVVRQFIVRSDDDLTFRRLHVENLCDGGWFGSQTVLHSLLGRKFPHWFLTGPGVSLIIDDVADALV